MANKIGAAGYEPYSGPDDERLPRGMRTRWSRERIQAWVDQANGEFAVVDVCTRCEPEHPLIAREIEPHYLTHVETARARVIIGMLMDRTRSSDAVLDEVRAYLDRRHAG